MVRLGDYEDAEDVEFSAIPNGQYFAQIEEVKSFVAKTGNQGLSVTFVLKHDEFKNRKLWRNFVFEGSDEKNTLTLINMFKGFLSAAGIDEDARKDVLTEDAVAVHNLVCEGFIKIKVGSHDFEGKTYNDVLGFDLVSPDEMPY